MFKTIVLTFTLFSLFGLNAIALDIVIKVAKENHKNYSIINLRDTNKFLCQEIKDDFKKVVKIVCAFDKLPSSKFNDLQNDFFKIKTEIKNKTFFLVITPIHDMKLMPMSFDLTKDDVFFKSTTKISSSWIILAYQDETPLLKKINLAKHQ